MAITGASISLIVLVLPQQHGITERSSKLSIDLREWSDGGWHALGSGMNASYRASLQFKAMTTSRYEGNP